MIQVNVIANNGEQAIKNLKKRMQRELVFRVLKTSRFYEPPSVKKVREKQDSERRIRKARRKRLQEE